MTKPTSDAQPSRLLPRRFQMIPPSHSVTAPSPAEHSSPQLSLASSESANGMFDEATHEHAIDFATNSWDLATGGLKTLTAKRELPTRQDRRTADVVSDEAASVSRSYMLALVVLLCLILMLLGAGVVLYVMLQQ